MINFKVEYNNLIYVRTSRDRQLSIRGALLGGGDDGNVGRGVPAGNAGQRVYERGEDAAEGAQALGGGVHGDGGGQPRVVGRTRGGMGRENHSRHGVHLARPADAGAADDGVAAAIVAGPAAQGVAVARGACADGGTGRRGCVAGRCVGADGDVPDGAHRRVRGMLRAGAAVLQTVAAHELCRPGAQGGVAEPGADGGVRVRLCRVYHQRRLAPARVPVAVALHRHHRLRGLAHGDAADLDHAG
ncbi:hypothetical protein [Segatella albensis]|uniref:hypothetical protein n=1 Tax=Segatella albensis TaxID=77768 RepID=UPI00046AD6E2|nr:hypothetical protein [Segatella albensis]